MITFLIAFGFVNVGASTIMLVAGNHAGAASAFIAALAVFGLVEVLKRQPPRTK